jgi:hypothetical protein
VPASLARSIMSSSSSTRTEGSCRRTTRTTTRRSLLDTIVALKPAKGPNVIVTAVPLLIIGCRALRSPDTIDTLKCLSLTHSFQVEQYGKYWYLVRAY